jgi:AcrR family transcriptional regulator
MTRTTSGGDERARPVEAIGLRERKAAATRMAIERSLRERLGRTPLAEILVDDLAADAGVSRMTFFNYFPTKEHAVDFLMVAWMFGIEEDIATRGLRGVEAIELVFASTGDQVQRNPEVLRRVHSYFAGRPVDRPLPVLTAADRLALAGGRAPTVEQPVGLGRLFIRLSEEADAAGEIELRGSSYELAHMLGAVLHGTSAVGHSSPDTDWRGLFRRHVRRALGLLGRGGREPPPARVPAAYRTATTKASGAKARKRKGADR